MGSTADAQLPEQALRSNTSAAKVKAEISRSQANSDIWPAILEQWAWMRYENVGGLAGRLVTGRVVDPTAQLLWNRLPHLWSDCRRGFKADGLYGDDWRVSASHLEEADTAQYNFEPTEQAADRDRRFLQLQCLSRC